MKAKDYKQILLQAYKDQELHPEDFLDTLEHFEKLVKEENDTLYNSDQLIEVDSTCKYEGCDKNINRHAQNESWCKFHEQQING